ncbi:MAG: agmatine deiminase family protein [Phycisphaerae bacterium]|nr:agmatine deiminase family protein [Phycisphaerae bacterium]
MYERFRFRIWFYLVVATVGTAFIVNVAPASEQGRPETPPLFGGARVLPDHEGAISEVLLHYDSSMEYNLGPVYRDLFSALPADVQLQVVCASVPAVVDFICTWGDTAVAHGREVHLISAGCEVSPWARDRRIARYYPISGTPAASVVPADDAEYATWQRNELALPQLLESAELAPGVLTSSVCIEGGNVVANMRHVFVGFDTAFANIDIEELHHELKRVLGRRPILVGGSQGDVPWCHVDMYLTPVDDRTALVASPSFAVALLAPEAADECGDMDLLLERAEQGLAVQPALDAVAKQLVSLDYTVLRLPAVVDEANEWMITYNNVLMEQRDGKRIVYMPIYHLPILDFVAEAIYRSLGFEVRTIDVSRIYQYGGAVRCLVNVTRRRPPASPQTHTIRHRKGSIRVLNFGCRHVRASATADSTVAGFLQSQPLQVRAR